VWATVLSLGISHADFATSCQKNSSAVNRILAVMYEELLSLSMSPTVLQGMMYFVSLLGHFSGREDATIPMEKDGQQHFCSA